MRVEPLSALISWRVAAILEQYADLETVRLRLRGRNDEFDEQMADVHAIAAEGRRRLAAAAAAAAKASERNVAADAASEQLWMTSDEAAALLRMTPQNVTALARRGAIDGERTTGRWVLSRASVEAHAKDRARWQPARS